jgi:hypothetical protein
VAGTVQVGSFGRNSLFFRVIDILPIIFAFNRNEANDGLSAINSIDTNRGRHLTLPWYDGWTESTEFKIIENVSQ